MSKQKIIALAVAAALSSGTAFANAKATQADDSILVMFKPGVSKQERVSTIKRSGASLRQLDAQGRDIKMRHIADGRIAKIKVPKGVNRDYLIKQLTLNPTIEIAEPNYLVKALVAPFAIPGDPRFGEMWGLNNTGQNGGTAGADISAIEAWNTTTGSREVIIGVIDSGMDYNHPDLIPNRWENDGSYPGHPYGYSTLNAANDPMDSDSHGTHVAGTIGAAGDNGIGIVGVSWNVTLLPCQFLGPTGGSTAGAIECIDYYTDLKTNYGVNIKATNNSWGGGGFSGTLRAAIQSAGDAGILFIAASGNDGADADVSPMYPAGYDLDVIVSVASTDRNDNLSVFSSGASNFGATTVDLGAPGSAILSTIPGNGYAAYSGTSMASPHVAGAAALLWSINPDITPLEMKAILMDSGDELLSLAGKTVSGKRLNLVNALAEADPTPSFRLSMSPGNQQIVAGANAEYSLVVGNIADWMGDVELSVSINPSIEGVSLSAMTAQPGDTLTVTVPTTASTAWGDYQLTVTGVGASDASIIKDISANLNVLPQGLADFSFENTTPIAIPDNAPVGIASIINVPNEGTVFSTDVGVNISHTWRGDLLVTLRSPEGTMHTLHNRTGGSADDIVNTWTVETFNEEAMQGDWTLAVSDNAGADIGTLNSWNLTITALAGDIVNPDPVAPVADFSYIASGLNVDFTDSSTDADNDINSWSWDFGDGVLSDEQNPSHSYAAEGSYSVSLTVTDSTGLSAMITQSVTLVESDITVTLHRAIRARTGSTIVDLRWTGATDSLDLYRDGQFIRTIENTGKHRDRFNSMAASATYSLCLEGTTLCSADLLVTF
ncbi:peptidase S8 [Arsukibacterium sp. MJ3]|uniref:S8 family serine peptidase n=1 Tax=Arsukibacterium sp. MJ3 TaxID=1632859 RepID=UPI0006270967|nr:S8 family serine peptidase [Arsukibacterium sp. MJ3]KKO50462.1 peptidase S8 [Arsukibacterium sp. MJ3]